MPWWMYLLLLVYLGACVFLIFVILIQSGKGGGLSSLAGASQGLTEMLGTTSSERMLNRWTSYCAITFMVLAILISIGGAQHARQRETLGLPSGAQTAPAQPLSTQNLPLATPVPDAAATPAVPQPILSPTPAPTPTE